MEIKETQTQNTEQKILEAAKRIFLKKGMEGARMQEIADEAGINKALLHYYFRTKDKLFDAVFQSTFRELIPRMMVLTGPEIEMEQKMKLFFENHISFLQENPYLPGFILHEINQNPERLAEMLQFLQKMNVSQTIGAQIMKEIEAGKIKPVDPRQLIINMLSLSVFPIAAAPLLKKVFGFTDEEYSQFIEERKALLPEFVINAIKKEGK